MEAGNYSSKSLQNLKYEETLDKLTNVSKNVLQLSFYSQLDLQTYNMLRNKLKKNNSYTIQEFGLKTEQPLYFK